MSENRVDYRQLARSPTSPFAFVQFAWCFQITIADDCCHFVSIKIYMNNEVPLLS